jgi:hypothetical protein
MPVDGDFGDEPFEPIDRLVIALRAHVRRAPKKPKAGSKPARNTLPGAVNWRDLAPRATPSDWVLVFDCETRTTPDQRLRFGGYQLRYKGQVNERGAFYEPDVLSEDELAILRHVIDDEKSNSDGVPICLRKRAEFVDEILFRSGAYFHPLLATLITGAARLMLSLAEHQIVEHELDWVFADTDSIAIGNTRNLPRDKFIETALRVRDWFKDLNPYGEDYSILQLEKVNFPPDKRDDLQAIGTPRSV